MADSPSGGGEKTEAASPKRLQDSAKKGDVLQSRELSAALVMLAGTLAFGFLGSIMVDALSNMLTSGLQFQSNDIETFDPAQTSLHLVGMILLPFAGLIALTIIAAIGMPLLLGSLGFRLSAINVKPEKLNPMKGLKRIFGTQGLVELFKSLAKVLLLGAIAVWVISSSLPQIFAFGRLDIKSAIYGYGNLFLIISMATTFGFFLIAGIDVPSQILQRSKRLKMTKQEVKDEHKEVEGSPEAKAALRQRQYETLSRSARKALDEATLVLNNPTHFSIVLRYRPGSDAVPVVLARGRGATALAIRELAEEKSVPMLQYPELTRAIYFTTPDGGAIDERLYVAVATVLAFLFRLDAQLAEEIERPYIEVPNDMRFDADGQRQTAH